jgi:hypothetical protein
MYHFCIYIHLYTIFVPYSPSYLLSLPWPLPPSPEYQPHPGQDLLCLPVLWFCRRKKKKSDIFCLFEIKVVYTGNFLVLLW